MRVLLANHQFSVSGASVCLFKLAVHLRAIGHTVSVVSVDPTPGRLRADYAQAGIPIVEAFQPSTYDVCIANTVVAAALVGRLGPFIPTIWWLHEAEIGLAILLRDISQLIAFQAASAIVFQTEFQRNDVYRSFVFALPPEKLHVIPNGVSFGAVEPVAATAGVLRIVSVGAVYPRKRHSDLIAAVSLLRSRLDVELVICGEVQDGLDAKARASVQAHGGRIRLTGEVDRAQCLAWMASADIFCLASDSESQPLTVLEAGLLGKPSVLSDLRCYADVYRHGVNCLTFPVSDVGLLSHALGALCADAGRRRQLGEAARTTARRFSEAALFARFCALIDDVASEASA